MITPPWPKGDPRYRNPGYDHYDAPEPKPDPWAEAHQLSEHVVDLMNASLHGMIARKEVDAMQVLVGILLSLLSIKHTLPEPEIWPQSLVALMRIAQQVIDEVREGRMR